MRGRGRFSPVPWPPVPWLPVPWPPVPWPPVLWLPVLALLLLLPAGCAGSGERELLFYQRRAAVVTLAPLAPAESEIVLRTGGCGEDGLPLPLSLTVNAPATLRGVVVRFDGGLSVSAGDFAVPLSGTAAAGLSLWAEAFRIAPEDVVKVETVRRDGHAVTAVTAETEEHRFTVYLNPESGLPVYLVLEADGARAEAAVVRWEPGGEG